MPKSNGNTIKRSDFADSVRQILSTKPPKSWSKTKTKKLKKTDKKKGNNLKVRDK